MDTATPTSLNPAPLSLALAVIASSDAPVLLLDGDLAVIAASMSFCRTFQIDPAGIAGLKVFDLGAGEWNVPQFRSLLNATVSGDAKIDGYEMDLKSDRPDPRHLVLNAQKLDYGDADGIRILLAVSDVTQARINERLKDDLVREKAVLLQEIQHRVANSLQIIASVLMLSARRVQSEETRHHLHDAHNRVMSIAAVQRQLATSGDDDVELRPYFIQLCQSLGASMISDHKRLTLTAIADKSSVNANVAVSFGLIVTELVINALKHAFPSQESGKITVEYRCHGRDWTLSVSDNGVGMPVHPNPAEAGLGTSIVEALSKRLHGDVAVADAKPGTTVSITHRNIAAFVDGAQSMPASRAV